MGLQDELIGQYREQRTKFVYYIIALCVTSIGFALYRTIGQALTLVQIPLAMALIGWGFSIFSGFRFITISHNTISTNLAYLRVEEETHPDVPRNDPNIKKKFRDKLVDRIESNMALTEKLLSRQQLLFYAGIVLFVTWHILEMYMVTGPMSLDPLHQQVFYLT